MKQIIEDWKINGVKSHLIVFASLCILIPLVHVLAVGNAPRKSVVLTLSILVGILEIPVLLALFIKTFHGRLPLTVNDKLLVLVGLTIVLLVSTFLVNWINIFDRGFEENELYESILTTFYVYLIVMVFCLPLVFFLNSRTSREDV
ncbi:MAG: hypothetical protein GC178_16500 [Flavobacteriales bacterium]|nr:hypothetical protein [Flavobacteriales bacterium]